mgnify:CR=1 FL=1
MQPDIQTIPTKHLIGQKIYTSLAENRTFELWSGFKPRVKEIGNRVGGDFYSVQDFRDNANLLSFTPETCFNKWAAVEVAENTSAPEGMESYTLPSGLYAVFMHKGTPATFPQTAAYIFGQWLPNSAYTLDQRPHFEVMSSAYNPASPDAEEEVWIPIKPKV